MRALAYRGPGRLVLEERPVPSPGAGEAVVRVGACAICGTDLRIAAGGHRAYADGSGRVPGHELTGTVAAVGEGAGLREGAVVFVAPNFGCGRCRACGRGDVNLCEHTRALGITEDGGFADYALLARELVAQGNVFPVAPGADPAAVALVEPLACVLRGSRACRIGEGDVVLVLGAGPIGLLHAAVARDAGAAAVVVGEPNAERRRRALGWGATAACGADPEELRAELAATGAPRGADAVVVATPAAAAQRAALELAAPGGRVNLFAGLPRGASTVELDTNLVHYRELVVTGTTASTNADCRDALALVLGGRIDTAALVDARFGLDAAAAAFALAASGRALKVVIEP
ncbi:MAG TPA: alcohol dehydrogenase catalytic domain-containing protein [Gaiellaceae bacterium]|nr:alcohol dehydrogenase catalytic domain-containing protein [Gaiellaceae bacterium]